MVGAGGGLSVSCISTRWAQLGKGKAVCLEGAGPRRPHSGPFPPPQAVLIVVTVGFIQVRISQALEGWPGQGCSWSPSVEQHVPCGLPQEYRSEKSLEELTKLVPPECNWCVWASLDPGAHHRSWGLASGQEVGRSRVSVLSLRRTTSHRDLRPGLHPDRWWLCGLGVLVSLSGPQLHHQSRNQGSQPGGYRRRSGFGQSLEAVCTFSQGGERGVTGFSKGDCQGLVRLARRTAAGLGGLGV